MAAAVSDGTSRALLTALVVLAVVGVLVLMRRGWRRRAGRQADLPVPSDQPLPGPAATPAAAPDADSATRCGPVSGRYLATTSTGDWLDRIVVHGLGVPSRADVTVRDDGVLITRTGARDLFVPRDDVLGARLGRGIAGAVYEEGGLVVLSWQLGDQVLDTGFRAKQADEHAELVAAVARLGPAGPGPATRDGGTG
jgi:hypothetical protein